jgi:hypothetical protein
MRAGMNRIRIIAGNVTAEADLNESVTANVIWETLPIESTTHTWGDEIYFTIPVKLGLEDGRETVELGDLGYWPTGYAFCIFFGQTPVSGPDEIRPASAVNVFGKLTTGPELFMQIKEGTNITIEKA